MRYVSTGNFIARRSNRFYGGLSPDLMIEQVLMRSLKTRGGMARGTGFTELQRSRWLLSMPVCSRYNLNMQTFTEVGFSTSDQHEEEGKTRILRDGNDVQVVYNFLSSRSPFSESTCVRNIFSGLASETLETNNFYDLGSNLVSKMVDKDVFSLKFKRNNMVKTLANTKYVKDKESGVSIDPALLFQRLLVMATNSSEIDLEEIMSFELCSFPPSLFEDREMLLKADKPLLAKGIVGFVKKEKEKSFLGGEIFEYIEGKEEEEEVSDILVNSIDKPIDIIEDAGASKSICA